MNRTLLVLGNVLVTSLAAAACTSSTSDLGEGGASGTTAAQGSGSTTKAAGSTSATKAATQATNNGATNAATSDDATTATGGGDCAAQATYEACDECFCTQNSAGCDRYYEIEADACFCGASAPCAAACANACTNDVDDPACDACAEGLSDDDACWTTTETQCAADADCSAYLTASEACEDLPD